MKSYKHILNFSQRRLTMKTLLLFLFVFAVMGIQTMAETTAPVPAPIPTPIRIAIPNPIPTIVVKPTINPNATKMIQSSYQITVRFIPVGSTDGSIVASVDKNWCVSKLTEINAIYKPAGLQFVFGELDALIKDDLLNLDVPLPSYAEGPETARQKLAEKYPKELVVFVRTYLRTPKYKAFNYSSVKADYIVAEPGSDPWGLAHEFGHFFGLFHTFDDGRTAAMAAMPYANRVSYVASILATAIGQGKVTEENALQFLDGDGVGDTPPDVAPPIFQPNDKAGEEVGPGSPEFIIIPVQLNKPTSSGLAFKVVNYELRPDKLNLMSYFTTNKTTGRPHLSPEQAERVYNIVKTGTRNRLATGQLVVR